MTAQPGWRKSSYSGSEGDNCVEVAVRTEAVHVRDSKDTLIHPLRITPTAWAAFTTHTASRDT